MTCLHFGCTYMRIHVHVTTVCSWNHSWEWQLRCTYMYNVECVCLYACRMCVCEGGELLSLCLRMTEEHNLVEISAMYTCTSVTVHVHVHFLSFSPPVPSGTHTAPSSVSGAEGGGLVASGGGSAEGGESRSPRRQASLEQRLSEVSSCN